MKKIWLHFKRHYLAYPAAYIAKGMMRLILSTCRIEIRGLDRFIQAASTERCILMLWHNRLAILPEILHRHASQFIYRAFISNSCDGEPLAIMTRSYSSGRILRVAHHARHQALHQMIAILKRDKEVAVLTPDGPRGPIYEVKPGVIAAAKAASAKIIPFSWSATSFWQLKTWDQFRLPKPFSLIVVTLGEPIPMESEVKTSNLKQILLALD